MRRKSLLAIFIYAAMFVPLGLHAEDIYPDLVSGTYVFRGQPAPLGAEDTPAMSMGAIRVDGASGDIGVLYCQLVDQANYDAILTFTVVLTDTTQNARVKLVSYAQEDCLGLQSEMSDNTAVMILIPPVKPTLME